ncbi:MAG: DUF1801 domain-containing protein [Cyclobacteriaceae bacterium]|nr:DUF1801 domain-containing protein [Cyclobacteriaceae bacterium]
MRKSVDEIVEDLPKNEKMIVKRLRLLVKECLPGAEEKGYYSFNVPFYKHHRMICFIWPPSLFEGMEKTKEAHDKKGVTLGFCQGNLMANDEGLLQKENRKQVYCMYFKKLSDINDDQIRALLFEADAIDQRFKKPRKL